MSIFILGMFSKDPVKVKNKFAEFLRKEGNSVFIDIAEGCKKDSFEVRGEAAARKYVEKFHEKKRVKLGCIALKGYEEERCELILELKQNSDLPVRQIASVLGISREIVQRVKV